MGSRNNPLLSREGGYLKLLSTSALHPKYVSGALRGLRGE